ncbi:MBL fold metallo-hydrolase [Undibacterium arcticum]|uniref:MBL fold metallo-hydrolase n=1 Tax=Undibacterium arcticum TaxID=1762892 RepID=UPI00361FD87D
MVRIDHVFVTHSHLDHICSIPFLVDTVGHRRNTPLMVTLSERRSMPCAPTCSTTASGLISQYCRNLRRPICSIAR